MQDGVEKQREAFESTVYGGDPSRWAYHDTQEPLIRYVRDRRVRLAIQTLTRLTGATPKRLTALVVCGGVGGEGSLLANLGFQFVVNQLPIKNSSPNIQDSFVGSWTDYLQKLQHPALSERRDQNVQNWMNIHRYSYPTPTDESAVQHWERPPERRVGQWHLKDKESCCGT